MLRVVIQPLVSSVVFTLLSHRPIWWNILSRTFNPGKLLLIIYGVGIFRDNFEVGRIFLTVEHVAASLDVLTAKTLSKLLLLNVSIMQIFNLSHLPFY